RRIRKRSHAAHDRMVFADAHNKQRTDIASIGRYDLIGAIDKGTRVQIGNDLAGRGVAAEGRDEEGSGPKSLGRFPVDLHDIGDLDVLGERDHRSGRLMGFFAYCAGSKMSPRYWTWFSVSIVITIGLFERAAASPNAEFDCA